MDFKTQKEIFRHLEKGGYVEAKVTGKIFGFVEGELHQIQGNCSKLAHCKPTFELPNLYRKANTKLLPI